MAPDGKSVVYLADDKIFSVPLGGGKDKDGEEPSELFKIRGQPGELRFSPDPEQPLLAFTSDRDSHSFLAVYDLEAGTLRYLDPGVDFDCNPVFSPDGRRIAFLRVPREHDRLPFTPRREALPFSIRVVDIATGKAQEVFRAAEGVGSACRFVSAQNQLLWGAGDRLVFAWERDGWLHLYSVPASSATGPGTATLLTPGDFEVQYVALSEDRQEVVYSSNQDDIDRQHVWRVAVDGGTAPRPVTSGKGIEWSPRRLVGGRIAMLASGARQPARAAIQDRDGKLRPLANGAVAKDFPTQHLVDPQQVVFSATDGMLIHGQLFLPTDLEADQRRPAVVFSHGGSRRQMLLGFHHRGYYHAAYAFNQYLASQGYIVLSVNYRSGIGYGMKFREALNYGARGASEYRDIVGAGLYLRGRPDVDAERIGLWGGSYGGYLTALGLARASDLFAAGVDLHGVHDWNIFLRHLITKRDHRTQEEIQRLAFASSPMAAVDSWRSPVLLIHGDDDRNVPFSETVELVNALRQRGVELELLVFPDEVHGFLLHRNWLTTYQAAAVFFDRHLKLKGSRASTPK
ncbi:MAG: S9 family peptidase [bacterium]|nr:S9 family peptidase [bacterium]